jgi:hypothetical protein
MGDRGWLIGGGINETEETALLMKECLICAPFNERDTTHYKRIGADIHGALHYMSQYRQFSHPEVSGLLKAALKLWHQVPIQKRLTDCEKAYCTDWKTTTRR